jgi:hypothetical protein
METAEMKDKLHDIRRQLNRNNSENYGDESNALFGAVEALAEIVEALVERASEAEHLERTKR